MIYRLGRACRILTLLASVSLLLVSLGCSKKGRNKTKTPTQKGSEGYRSSMPRQSRSDVIRSRPHNSPPPRSGASRRGYSGNHDPIRLGATKNRHGDHTSRGASANPKTKKRADPDDWLADCPGPAMCPEHKEMHCEGEPGACECSCVFPDSQPAPDPR